MRMTKTQIGETVFQVIAITVAAKTCCLFYQKYAANQDISSISYQRYNVDLKDVYPAFSLCLFSSFGLIFQQNILDMNGWEGGYVFHKMLLGQLHDEDGIMDNVTTSRKTKLMAIDFDNVSINFSNDIFHQFLSVTKEGDHIEAGSTYQLPFEVTYQDPNQICITIQRQHEHMKNMILNFEELVLNAHGLYNISASLHIYIHKYGELTRQLHKPTLSFSFHNFKEMTEHFNNEYRLRIDQVEILRSHPDANVPCNPHPVPNDDNLYRLMVMQKIQCLPNYWKRFVVHYHPFLGSVVNLPECVHQEQFREISDYYLPDRNVENATKHYLRSCNQMKIIVSTQKASIKSLDKLVLLFEYANEEYKVSCNANYVSQCVPNYCCNIA